MVEYDPLDRVRSIQRNLPFIALVLAVAIPIFSWGLVGFVAMDWNPANWDANARGGLAFASLAMWALSVAALSEYCKETLKKKK